MKNLFISVFIIGSLLSLTFGLAIIPQMNGQNHSQCPFEAAGMMSCDQAQGLVNYVSAHVSAFSQFFLATSADGFAFFFAALFSLFVLAVFVILGKSKNALPAPTKIRVRIRKRGASVSQSRLQFVHWLSLHENSPALIARRA